MAAGAGRCQQQRGLSSSCWGLPDSDQSSPCRFFPPRSALGAEADAPSRRLRTKAAGDDVIRSELGPLATIFKPAAMTGTEDKLFNMYAGLAKRTPFMPLVDGGRTRLQPVWVRDVAQGARGLGGGGGPGLHRCARHCRPEAPANRLLRGRRCCA